MRRFLCLIALLGRFASQDYVWSARPVRRPTPIVRPRPVDPLDGRGERWWHV